MHLKNLWSSDVKYRFIPIRGKGARLDQALNEQPWVCDAIEFKLWVYLVRQASIYKWNNVILPTLKQLHFIPVFHNIILLKSLGSKSPCALKKDISKLMRGHIWRWFMLTERPENANIYVYLQRHWSRWFELSQKKYYQPTTTW